MRLGEGRDEEGALVSRVEDEGMAKGGGGRDEGGGKRGRAKGH